MHTGYLVHIKATQSTTPNVNVTNPVSKARIRYSEALIEPIVKVLELGGTDEDAATAAGIELRQTTAAEFQPQSEPAPSGR
jgi:hypothetical protein